MQDAEGKCLKSASKQCGLRVPFTHRHHLRVAAACCPSFDAKGGSLAGLTDAGECLLAQGRAESLGKANCSGGFAFAEWSRVYTRADDIVAVGRSFQSIAYRQRDLGLGISPLDHFILIEAGSDDQKKGKEERKTMRCDQIMRPRMTCKGVT